MNSWLQEPWVMSQRLKSFGFLSINGVVSSLLLSKRWKHNRVRSQIVSILSCFSFYSRARQFIIHASSSLLPYTLFLFYNSQWFFYVKIYHDYMVILNVWKSHDSLIIWNKPMCHTIVIWSFHDMTMVRSCTIFWEVYILGSLYSGKIIVICDMQFSMKIIVIG